MKVAGDRKERFLSKIKQNLKSGCWVWIGSFLKDEFGRPTYGQFYWGIENGKEKQVKASRAAWLIMVGSIEDNLHVLHKCDNKACVNPQHLYIGTHAQNMKDKVKSGLAPKGFAHYKFRGTKERLDQLKKCLTAGLNVEQSRQIVGMGWTSIYRYRKVDKELDELMLATKSKHYSEAAIKRGCRPINRYEKLKKNGPS